MIGADIPNEYRKLIYERDGYACALCGDPRHLALHHVLPRSSGGGNSPMNLITLCRYCHGNAHGVHLSELVIEPEEVEQACVEYLSDMYAAVPRDPKLKLALDVKGDLGSWDRSIFYRLVNVGKLYLRGVPPKWSGTTYDDTL